MPVVGAGSSPAHAPAPLFPLTLQWLTVDDINQLLAWRGRLLLLRDNVGRRVFGTYLTVDIADRYLVGGWRSVATLNFVEVDHDEAV